MQILKHIIDSKKKNKKLISILIDPDKIDERKLIQTTQLCSKNKVDYIFFGGSFITKDKSQKYIKLIKKNSDIPVIIFPGANNLIDKNADGLLMLSLISGRNPSYLIGKHVENAYQLHNSNLEIIPVGYIVVESGHTTAVSYISNTLPIPSTQYEIINSTALAGEMLGKRIIYLEAGSGAKNSIDINIISNVSKIIRCPIIVGGGIDSIEKILSAYEAGADMIVVGNHVERNINFLNDIGKKIKNVV